MFSLSLGRLPEVVGKTNLVPSGGFTVNLRTLMLSLLFSILALFALSGGSAFALECLSPAEIRESYKACMDFLKLSKAKQQEIVDNTGYTLEEGLWACKLQKKKGLASMLKNGREVCDYLNGGGGGGGSSHDDDVKKCSSSIQCSGLQHCINRKCEDVSRQSCDSGAHSCPPGEKCISGKCK